MKFSAALVAAAATAANAKLQPIVMKVRGLEMRRPTVAILTS